MKRSTRLGVVLKLAIETEDATGRSLQAAREALTQAEGQLDQIERYQQDYIDAVNVKVRGLNTQTMINDRAFLGQLVGVIDRQKQHLKQLTTNEQQCLEQWKASHLRRKNIENLIERLRLNEDSAAEKQLQKLMDELSSQRFNANSSSYL